MIEGLVVLEDTEIKFQVNYQSNTVMITITDLVTRKFDFQEIDQANFFKALAIAVHMDGMPDYKVDYPDAESIMPSNPLLRWIP